MQLPSPALQQVSKTDQPKKQPDLIDPKELLADFYGSEEDALEEPKEVAQRSSNQSAKVVGQLDTQVTF
jgi:hypothetical protein